MAGRVLVLRAALLLGRDPRGAGSVGEAGAPVLAPGRGPAGGGGGGTRRSCEGPSRRGLSGAPRKQDGTLPCYYGCPEGARRRALAAEGRGWGLRNVGRALPGVQSAAVVISVEPEPEAALPSSAKSIRRGNRCSDEVGSGFWLLSGREGVSVPAYFLVGGAAGGDVDGAASALGSRRALSHDLLVLNHNPAIANYYGTLWVLVDLNLARGTSSSKSLFQALDGLPNLLGNDKGLLPGHQPCSWWEMWLAQNPLDLLQSLMRRPFFAPDMARENLVTLLPSFQPLIFVKLTGLKCN